MASHTRLRTARIAVLWISALAIAALFAGIVRQAWVTHSAAADVLRQETYGTQMLHPMTGLLASLVEAQSAAVRGERVDSSAVRSALAAVATVDETRGGDLQTHQRLTNLTTHVESALAAAPAGRLGYDAYSDLVTLTEDLTRQIGDTSHLIHDSELDSYYLMEAAIVRLPDAVVLAGRASDLVALAGDGTLQGEDAIRAAVARFGVSAAAEAVNAGLTQSVDATNRADLGSNIAERLDTFKAAADAFAPPTMLVELAGPVDSPTLSANARRVYAAATPLAHLLLSELQAILKQRTDDLAGQWWFTLVATAASTVIGIVVLSLLIAGRRRAHDFGSGDESTGSHARPDSLALSTLTYARDLLDAGDLVHTGRAGGSGLGTQARQAQAAQARVQTNRTQAWGDGDAR